MRKYLVSVAGVVLSVVLVASLVEAQPGIGITKTAPLSGKGNVSDPLKITPCAATQIYKMNAGGTAWECASDGGGGGGAGDIESVTAGTGLTGGGLTGAVTLNTACGTGLSCNADDITLNLAVTDCAAGSFFDVNTATGAFTCAAEVGDISGASITANMGLTGGGTSGAVSFGLLSTCADGQVLKSGGTGTSWTCANDSTGTGESTIAGAGLTLTGTTVDAACLTGLTCNADSIQIAARDFGDVTTTAAGATWTIDNSAVTLAKIANIATARILGRVTAASGVVEELTGTQATTLLDSFTSALKGLAPASGGGTTNYLRADGTWAAPPGTGGLSGLTTNTITKATSATTIGNSSVTDSGTLVTVTNPLTVTGSFTGGDATTDSHAASGEFVITETTGALFSDLNGGAGLVVRDDSAVAAGVGGGMYFGGKWTGSTYVGAAAGIKAMKTNATDGNYSFDMAFGTRPNSGALTEWMRITDQGSVGIGDTTPDYKLDVAGTLGVDGAATLSSTLNGQGAVDFDSTLNVDGNAALNATTTVAQLKGTVQTRVCEGNDIALAATTTVLVCSSGSVYGLQGGTNGRILYVLAGSNVDTANEAVASTAANRITLVSGVGEVWNTGQVGMFMYDGATSRWKTISRQRFGNVYSETDITAAGNSLFGNADTDTVNSAGTLGFSGTNPTISSCGGGSVTGEAQSFQVTVGSAITACVINFNRTFTNAPYCTFSAVNLEAAENIASISGTGGGDDPRITATTTTATLTFSANNEGSPIYNVFCPGRY